MLMLFTAITFVVSLGLVIGAYWMLVVVPENREQSTLRKRLKSEDPAAARLKLVKETVALSGIAAFNSVLTQLGGLSGPLSRLLEQSGLSLNVGSFVLLTTVCALTAAVVVDLYLPWWVALMAALVVAPIPLWLVYMKKGKRIRQFEEQFPEAIQLIARALRAGHAFPTGLKMAADELPPPAGTEFKLLFDRQNYGAEMPDALKAFAERIPSIDARFFVTAVLTQREAGGNLSEVLDRLAGVMRERFEIRREVRTRSAHGRITAFVLAGLPPVLAVMMTALSPAQMKILVTDPLGIRMVIGGIVLQIIGTLVVRKLVDIEY